MNGMEMGLGKMFKPPAIINLIGVEKRILKQRFFKKHTNC